MRCRIKSATASTPARRGEPARWACLCVVLICDCQRFQPSDREGNAAPFPSRVSPARCLEATKESLADHVESRMKVAELAKSAIGFPPMQRGASFGLSAIKEQIAAAMKKNAGN